MERLLVLGGTSFAGPAVVEAALARGWDVTVFNRGRGPSPPAAVRTVIGDRTRPAELARLADGEWDVVVDTWVGPASTVAEACALLTGRAGRYVHVSSASVYASPLALGATESAPTVAGAGDSYPGEKRAAELAVEQAFGERGLVVRAGLVLGPRENAGRLPWWLLRLERGGDVPVPGPAERPLQYIDVRDLAAWMLTAAAAGAHGAHNAASRPGHATMGSLLEACRAVTGARARLRWVGRDALARAGVEPWTDVPCWLPQDDPDAGLLALDVTRAHAAGLRTRPVEETVRDTWAWLLAAGRRAPLRSGLTAPGMSPAAERALLAAAGD